MLRKQGLALRLVLAASVMCGGLVLGAGTPVVMAQPSLQVVANNLDNPRGLAFAPDGSLYVAEAGKGGSGPCIQGPDGDQQCYGATGAITRVISGTQERVVTGLPSLAGEGGASATGPQDISFLSNGDAYVPIGLGANPDIRATLGTTGTQFGQLMRVDLAGTTTNVADVAAYEKANDPDGLGADSNPYAVVALRDRRYVVDAGGNDVLQIGPSGTITTVVTFTTRLVASPPIPNLPPQIAMQPVPNSLAIGPEGALYVGELTGFPFPVGGARVYKVVPGQPAQIFAQGFTNIIDMAFASDGSLYVLEIASKGLLQAEGPNGDFSGELIRVDSNGTKTSVLSQGLTAPTGIAISPSGGLYISNFGVVPGQGQVVRVNLCAAGATGCTEPTPLTLPAGFSTQVPAQLTPVVQGLDNPRGLAFGPNGALYVAEAGKGGTAPCIGDDENGQNCYGATGAITRVISGTQQRIVSGLPSLAGQGGNFATGPHDVSVQANGDVYAVVGLGANPDVRATLGISGTGFGQLMRVKANGSRTTVADIASYERAVDPVPSDEGPDSNPYALVTLGNRHYVADAGGNDILQVDERGAITTVATFTNRLVPAPPIPNLPPEISMQAVPNSIAVGPDGALYVGQLTGFPFPIGGARVYRIVPGKAPEVFAEGFTNIIDLAVGDDGSLYVLEITAKGLLQAEGPGGDLTGALIRVAPNGARATIASEGLTAPTSVAIGPDGGIYVSNFGVFAGQGQVVRVNLCDAQDTTCEEPQPQAQPLVASLSGASEVDSTGAPNKGDLDGSGFVVVTIDPEAGEACVQGSVSNVAQLTMAHIHRGAAGTNGPVVVPFNNAIAGNTLSGCSTADKALLADILANPSNYYFNVHNQDFPAGALRGQLARSNEVARTNFLFLPIIVKP